MGKINWNGVILGGILAGIIIDVGEYVLHGVLLGPEWREVMEALGRPLQETLGNMVFYVLLGLAYGILAVWLYAAIRPRYGAGPRTALYAGVGVWLLGYLLPTLSVVPMGLYPGHLIRIALLGGLAEILVATLAGAWLYKEQEMASG